MTYIVIMVVVHLRVMPYIYRLLNIDDYGKLYIFVIYPTISHISQTKLHVKYLRCNKWKDVNANRGTAWGRGGESNIDSRMVSRTT